MIKINILPEDLRKKKTDFGSMFAKYHQHKTLVLPVASILSAVIVLFVLIIVFYPVIQSHSLRKLEMKWKSIETQYGDVLKLKKDLKSLQDISRSIKEMEGNRNLWSKRLNEISDSLPNEIQLIEVSTRLEKTKEKSEKTVLTISGIVPLYPGEKAVGDFLKGLRENSDFVKTFPEIEPPSTVTTPEGYKKFVIRCCMPTVPMSSNKKESSGTSSDQDKGKEINELKAK